MAILDPLTSTSIETPAKKIKYDKSRMVFVTPTGKFIRLSPLSTNVLLHLMKHEDKIVTRDTLKKLFFKNDSKEEAINVCISRIRTALKHITPYELLCTFKKRGIMYRS